MKSLRQIYWDNKKALESVREKFSDEGLEGPLLMEIGSYYEQPVKVFIVGQETNGWCCDYNDHHSLLETYRDFNMGENYYSSPFWNMTRKIEGLIGIEHYSCAWSNINRYDHNGTAPKGEILGNIESLDYLVEEELSNIKPDVCFFFTNRKYDYRLKKIYTGIQMDPINGLPFNHFVHLRHQSLPKHSFRTPHPKTMRLQKWEDAFFSVMKEILPRVENTQQGAAFDRP